MLKEHLNYKKKFSLSKLFLYHAVRKKTIPGDSFTYDLMKSMDTELLCTIGKIAMEKLASLNSKMRDDTATAEDRQHAAILGEIAALASNRVSVTENEALRHKGGSVWVERTSESHFPHIRLHGGAIEDDPIA